MSVLGLDVVLVILYSHGTKVCQRPSRVHRRFRVNQRLLWTLHGFGRSTSRIFLDVDLANTGLQEKSKFSIVFEYDDRKRRRNSERTTQRYGLRITSHGSSPTGIQTRRTENFHCLECQMIFSITQWFGNNLLELLPCWLMFVDLDRCIYLVKFFLVDVTAFWLENYEIKWASK